MQCFLGIYRYLFQPKTFCGVIDTLKRADVQEQDMLKVFRGSVRPILEFAEQVWQDIPDYLSDRIESVQTGHLKSYIQTARTVKHCRYPTKVHFPTDASFINLWLR